jgi:phosphatidylcholine synthase
MTLLTRNRFSTIRAWMVHLYTSLGLVVGFFALDAVLRGDVKTVFICMLVALFIDATDGTMARAWKVTYWAPQFDGRKLDDITDYLNYAFIPLFFAYRFEMVSGGWLVIVLFAVLAAAYGFCQKAAKTNDGFFTGFPNFWNILIFYLYIFHLPVEINAFIILACAIFIFVPVTFMSYSSPIFQSLNKIISLVYGLFLAAIIATINEPIRVLVWISLVFPLYYVGTSLALHLLKSSKLGRERPDVLE